MPFSYGLEMVVTSSSIPFWVVMSRWAKPTRCAGGSWQVEVNHEYLSASDLEAAKRLFVERYDRPLVQLSPTSLDDTGDLSEDFAIVDLTPLQQQALGRLPPDDE